METCQQATKKTTAQKTDMDILLYIEYVYKNFGFIPKWLNISTY